MNVIYPGYKGCETTTFEHVHPSLTSSPFSSMPSFFSPFKRETRRTEREREKREREGGGGLLRWKLR